MKDEMSKSILTSAFKAVSEAEGWEFLKEFNPPDNKGFMFCEPTPELTRINSAIFKHYDGHSGSTYGWTMRCMELIAKNGWEAFKTQMS